MSRPNWSRKLPRPLKIPSVMTLKTLADVRKLIGHLPADRRELNTWRHVAAELDKAAAGTVDLIDDAVAAADGAVIGGHEVPARVTQRRFPPRWINRSLTVAANARSSFG